MKFNESISMNTNLSLYYTQRASHYEDIYQLPQRKTELDGLALQLQEIVHEKPVLEIACGTGYWTEKYAPQASRVLATDTNETMLALAQSKTTIADVQFQIADAFALPEGEFSVAIAGFWWSHVKRSEQSLFLQSVQKACGSGATLVMFDNCYVEGDSTPIARTDSEGNTYQIRRLPDNSRHEVIKNFPTDSALRKKLSQHARDIRIFRDDYFWMLTCTLR